MSVIDQIKDKLDIVEVVSAYVPLQKAGRNFKALCPFHAEKTPSFYVFPESQRWHCFGACAEGGDVFSFVMKREGWDFSEALRELARRAGVELRARTPAQVAQDEQLERLREVLAAAAGYYHHLLRHSPQAEQVRAYLVQRGLNDETVERFQLGYSLDAWEALRNHLTGQGYTAEELVAAGLLVEREDGTGYDRFRGRLMIPIRDVRGRVIGFGARTLDPEELPKYINSPQTRLFDKSRTLFGLDVARQAIRAADRAVIVEGYMDVMQAHQAGFRNVVAQMGTALTEAQLRQLQRYTRRLVLALDADVAGAQATLRGLEVARGTLEREWQPVFDPRGLVGYEGRLGADIRILTLPTGYDPDDLIRQAPERWSALVGEATPVVDFYLQVLLTEMDPTDSKAKAAVVEALLPVLRDVADPVEREDYAQKLARALRVDARTVLARLGQAERRAVRRPREPRAPEVVPPPEQADLEGYCLTTLIQGTGLLAQANAALTRMNLAPLERRDFDDVECREIFRAWETVLADTGPGGIERLWAALPPDLYGRLEELLTGEMADPSGQAARLSARDEASGRGLAEEPLTREAIRSVLRLRQRNLRRRAEELRILIVEAQEEGDLKADQYAQELVALTRARQRTDRALARRWTAWPELEPMWGEP